MASKGKRKPNIRDISRQAPTFEQRKALNTMLADIEMPSLVVAILGAATLEYELERLIRERFRRKDDHTWARLTGENGPLMTFNQKVLAAYGFGIIDDVLMDGLHTVALIRNQFAHAKMVIDFDHELIAKELSEIILPKSKRTKLYKDLMRARKQRIPKIGFIFLCFTLEGVLLDKGTRLFNARSRRWRKKNKMPADWWLKLMGKEVEQAQPGALSGLYGGGPKPQGSQEGISSTLAEALRLHKKDSHDQGKS